MNKELEKIINQHMSQYERQSMRYWRRFVKATGCRTKKTMFLSCGARPRHINGAAAITILGYTALLEIHLAMIIMAFFQKPRLC